MAAAEPSSSRRNSNTQLLQELETLSQSLYQAHTTRRTASLVLPRNSVPPLSSDEGAGTTRNDENINPKPRQRRMSLSPWRSRPKLDDEKKQRERDKDEPAPLQKGSTKLNDNLASSDKKGLWNWKPIRALSHIGMQKLSCLFSVEVVTVQGLPASMNGLRLSVRVRKKEAKDGAVQTMPSRVSQGAADFEETMFIRCHVYCTHGGGKQKLQFEPRPFLIYVFAVDAEELDFGRSAVDLSLLIRESIEKNSQGTRVRQWDKSFNLSGKAKGGELVLKLGFQLMEKDGGIGIYNQDGGHKSGKGRLFSSSSTARKHSKASFSIPSPRMSSRAEAWTPSQIGAAADFHGMDDLNLDDPAPVPSTSPSVQKSEELEPKIEDIELPEFDIVDKGVEVQERRDQADEALSEENSDKRSVSSEVVKETVHDQFHLTRLTELDSIAQQIKALESVMADLKPAKTEEELASERLDAEEETVTKEFLQMLEDEGASQFEHCELDIPLKLEGAEDSKEAETKVFVPDLGKGIGCVVQTRDGGYLVAMNPLDIPVARKDTPKLAMQISKPWVFQSNKSMSGLELFQKMASIGLEALGTKIISLMPMDELMGKTAEQIAFEGIASAIIQGRNKEGASSSAARTIAAVKSMANAMNAGRKERISTGIWNVSEDPVTVEEILAFSMQKIEAMAVEALKIQAEMAEENAPFDISPVTGKDHKNHPLAAAVPLDDWIKNSSGNTTFNSETGEPASITVSVVVQLRDPLRRYEAVGGPVIAFIKTTYSDEYEEDKRFKVASLHVGGLKVKSGGRRDAYMWDSEKQRLTAMQWLVAYFGLGKAAGKKGKQHAVPKGQDILWSISSRVMADMWLKSMRNPDVKLPS
ncbi:protein PLASTID MOVEMENT IMPAIRED 1 [Diospyros lotus]|uniref:protein PLASTID MOVEMENT IMPAIRED 1 n=1 Tax=Diospyros lotus TaxID=55363 RepID=UPI00224F08D9|nr:protein PLASTID MOVEMENT IMPAIRED 1 [Diospyros lotus]